MMSDSEFNGACERFGIPLTAGILKRITVSQLHDAVNRGGDDEVSFVCLMEKLVERKRRREDEWHEKLNDGSQSIVAARMERLTTWASLSVVFLLAKPSKAKFSNSSMLPIMSILCPL